MEAHVVVVVATITERGRVGAVAGEEVGAAAGKVARGPHSRRNPSALWVAAHRWPLDSVYSSVYRLARGKFDLLTVLRML